MYRSIYKYIFIHIHTHIHINTHTHTYIYVYHTGVAQGALAFNLVQRKSLQLSLNEPLDVAPWFPPRDNVYIFQITVEVDFPNKARATSNPIDAELLGKYTAKIFQKQCVSVSQDILIDFQGDSLTLRITELQITKGASVPTTESIAVCGYLCIYVCVASLCASLCSRLPRMRPCQRPSPLRYVYVCEYVYTYIYV